MPQRRVPWGGGEGGESSPPLPPHIPLPMVTLVRCRYREEEPPPPYYCPPHPHPPHIPLPMVTLVRCRYREERAE